MKVPWPNLVSAAVVLAPISACILIPSATPVPPGTMAPIGVPTNASSPIITTETPPASPPTFVPATPTSGSSPNGEALSLVVLSPIDGAIVTTSQVEVTGTASPGAVVTVNDSILLVGEDGKFETTISLDEGPNLIEIVTSNDAGDETTLELTVTYAP